MSMTEIAGALFTAFFAANSVLLRSAGLDSAERFSRSAKKMPALAAVLAASALAANSISYLTLSCVFPLLGFETSTVADGAVAVFSTVAAATAAELLTKRYAPSVRELLGGEAFTVGCNSAVLGIVLLTRAYSTDLYSSIIYCLIFSASVVFTCAAVSVWRFDLREHKLPGAFRASPILLLLFGLAAMVMQGYLGVTLPL